MIFCGKYKLGNSLQNVIFPSDVFPSVLGVLSDDIFKFHTYRHLFRRKETTVSIPGVKPGFNVCEFKILIFCCHSQLFWCATWQTISHRRIK
jgi:hypothetical protein